MISYSLPSSPVRMNPLPFATIIGVLPLPLNTKFSTFYNEANTPYLFHAMKVGQNSVAVPYVGLCPLALCGLCRSSHEGRRTLLSSRVSALHAQGYKKIAPVCMLGGLCRLTGHLLCHLVNEAVNIRKSLDILVPSKIINEIRAFYQIYTEINACTTTSQSNCTDKMTIGKHPQTMAI